MRRKHVILLAVMTVVFVLGLLFVTVDFLPNLNVYGVNVGTGTSYCSLDLVSGNLAASCQSGN